MPIAVVIVLVVVAFGAGMWFSGRSWRREFGRIEDFLTEHNYSRQERRDFMADVERRMQEYEAQG